MYPEHIKNSDNSIIKTDNPIKMGKGSEQAFVQRRHTKDQQTQETMTL